MVSIKKELITFLIWLNNNLLCREMCLKIIGFEKKIIFAC